MFAEHRISLPGLATVVALHGAVIWGLLQMDVIRLPAPQTVLTVSLLPRVDTSPPRPEIVPPRPKPVMQKPKPAPVQQPIMLAAPAESPAPATAQIVEVPTVPIVAAPPAPTFAPPAPPAPTAAPTRPRFDADYLDNPKPAYPSLSRRMGEEGRVVLRVSVSAAGLAQDVQLHASSGHPRLDTAALETVRRWKFVPARLGSDAVAASVLVPIVFSLKD